MVDWFKIKKIDGHIHILPDEVHEANPDSEDVWKKADLHKYHEMMGKYHIDQAVIMPLNDPWLMSMKFTISNVHKNLCAMKQQYPHSFYAFADVDARNTSMQSVKAIERAIELELDGIKLHPSNTGMNADDEYNKSIFTYAQKNKIPVAIHSYPNSKEDPCAPKRIVHLLEQFPQLIMIVCHMGAYQWEELLPEDVYIDISAILPDYIQHYGLKKTNEIMRLFGPDRLIFASDYPDNRFLKPEEIYEFYFNTLNQMDFTEEEAAKIAYQNIEKIMSL